MREPPIERPAHGRPALRWTMFGAVLLAFIVLPFVLFEDTMNRLVDDTLRQGLPLPAVAAATVVLLLADIVLPVPSSVVLAGCGFLLGAAPGAVVAFAGLSCASAAGYAIGRWAGGPLAGRLVGAAERERFGELFSRRGALLLLAFRATPVLAEASVLLAGTARMPLPRFAGLVSIGNAVVATLYALLGAWSTGPAGFVVASAAAMGVPLVMWWLARRVLGLR